MITPEIVKPALLGAVLGSCLGVPPVAAAFAIFGIWSGLTFIAPLLATPSLVLVIRRHAALPALSFTVGAMLAFGIVLSSSADLSEWGLAVGFSIWVALCVSVLASPVVFLLNRGRDAV